MIDEKNFFLPRSLKIRRNVRIRSQRLKLASKNNEGKKVLRL